MNLVREGQKLNLIFNKGEKTVEITCVVGSVEFDRVFSTAGIIAFNSIIINGGLEDVFTIEYDENAVRMEPYTESPTVEEMLELIIKDKSGKVYSAKTIEIGTKGIKFVTEAKLALETIYDFTLITNEEFGNIEFTGLINSYDEVFPDEYVMSYTKISGADRQNILRFIYSVG